jgi:hypothetical protein
MSSIAIQKKTITTVTDVTSIEIESGVVVLNTSAKFTVRLLDSNGSLIDIKFVELSGQDYDNWGSDDDYVVSYILSELGMSK